jgi:hypothetical protein
MSSALEYIYRRPDLIVKCEHILSRAGGNSEDDLYVVPLKCQNEGLICATEDVPSTGISYTL